MSSATGIRLLYCEMERPGNLPSHILPNNTMDYADTKENIPRPLSSNQGRVGKAVTGSTMMKNTTILSQGQLQLRKKVRLGTWNIRSMLQLGKVQLLGDEMVRLGVDICGLSEVRWNGQGHFTTLDGHTIV